MRGRHEAPLAGRFRGAAHGEATEAACLFDLAVHWFDGLLPEAIAAPEAASTHASSHLLDVLAAEAAAMMADTPLRASVLLPADRDVAADASLLQLLHVRFGEVPLIRRELLRRAADVRLDLRDDRRKEWRVDLRREDRLGDDDLMLGIDGELRVVALDESVADLQDAALGIGEVALRLGLRLRDLASAASAASASAAAR